MTTSRRKHARYAVALTAEIDAGAQTLGGTTHNVSMGGAAVIVPQAVVDGTHVRLTLIMTGDGVEDPEEDPLITDARVIWTAERDDGQTTVGLRFVEMAAGQSAHLGRFLEAIDA
ncbi:MAG: PilZ domain-containing protein [Proteobacteria bacterium]|nr:PilZ domain-containing protein [Pseudomonadota bacterium]